VSPSLGSLRERNRRKPEYLLQAWSGRVPRGAGMEKLREEILQAERTRSDLLKLKLGLVGTIGAFGLGFYGSGTLEHAELVLAVIPLVSVYVDLLCRHLTLRIVVIGTFLRTSTLRGDSNGGVLKDYEEFAQEARTLPRPGNRNGSISAFALEDWALIYSTYALSAGVLAYGFYLVGQGSQLPILFLLSGGTGLVATLFGNRQYNERFAAVANLRPPHAPGSP
jgi:hypothetical protein